MLNLNDLRIYVQHLNETAKYIEKKYKKIEKKLKKEFENERNEFIEVDTEKEEYYLQIKEMYDIGCHQKIILNNFLEYIEKNI